MTNNYYFNFIEKSESEISKNDKKQPLSSLCDYSQFSHIDATSKVIASVLSRSIENLDNELIKFEKFFSSSQNIVLWASDYNDVFDKLKKIIKSLKIKSVRLPNVNFSTIFRETGIQYFIRENRLKLSEDGDIQLYAPDLLFSDTGQILLLNQSNKSLEILNNSKCNVFFATIDQVVCSSVYAEIFQQFLLTSGSALQEMILYKGSSNCKNYLFIIDNQRSEVLRHRELRQSLSCIHCNSCSMVCPVYQTIGPEPYDNVFTGPLAHVTLPLLETLESYRHLTYACTQCGRCEEVCPVKIPIRDMILEQRHLLFPDMMIDKGHRRIAAVMRKYFISRKKMNSSAFLKRHLLKKNLSVDYKKSHRIIQFAKDSFNKTHK